MKTEREIELEKQVAELRAALGVYQASADWVPRADHHAELRRVAEAVQHDLWYALKAALGPGKHQQVLSREVDLARERIDAIVRGGQGDGFNELDVAVYQEARAALADPNLGADWVPRAEMEEQQRQYAENLAGREQQCQAELRRVSEAVQLRCVAYVVGCGFVDDIELRKIAAGMMATDHVDLGAIVRGGK